MSLEQNVRVLNTYIFNKIREKLPHCVPRTAITAHEIHCVNGEKIIW